MNNNTKNIIIFNGQSGQKILDCLTKLKSELEEPQNVEIISIEKRMEKITETNFKDLLKGPPLELERLWSETFDNILSEIKDLEEMILLTFHSAYYLLGVRHFFYPSDFKKFSKLNGKVKMVITFIDDVYDIYTHLMSPGEMFGYMLDERRYKTKSEAIFESIDNLHFLLNWREHEIEQSRQIARFLSVPFYIVPIKFPAFMVSRLVKEDIDLLKIFYLAHPIRLVREKRKLSLIGEINDFTKRIIGYSNTFLFYPTGIDELRIRCENGLYKPQLDDRWEPPFSEDKWVKPFSSLPIERINPLNPLQETKFNRSIELAISSSIERLIKRIDNQIASRDYTFIEASKDGIFVYRPDFESSDILKEVDYNIKLWKLAKEKGDSTRKNYILISREDLGYWRSEKLCEFLRKQYEKISEAELRQIVFKIKPKLNLTNMKTEDPTELNLKELMPNEVKNEIKNALLPLLYKHKKRETPQRKGILEKEMLALERNTHEKTIQIAIEEIATPQVLKTLCEAEEISICKSLEEIPAFNFLEKIFRTGGTKFA